MVEEDFLPFEDLTCTFKKYDVQALERKPNALKDPDGLYYKVSPFVSVDRTFT